MKTLYLECQMGAAGDMLTAALLELCDRQKFLDKMNRLHLPGVELSAQKTIKCGIIGTQMTVKIHGMEESHDHHTHEHHHTHTSMKQITDLIQGLDVSERVKADAIAIYQLIAEAESHAHQKPVEEIHFHEVGMMDAVADILGVCLLMEELAPEQVIVSPVHVGSGHVHCAHGILPVPAPATAYLLKDIPMYSSSIKGELCTPTGAAILSYFASAFDSMPVMKATAVGYGFGKKDFPQLNCIRAFIGETENTPEQILELRCNLDDMTPECIGFAMEMLFEAGALDVFTVPIGMKKNRPAVLLTCLCRQEQRESMLHEIFKHTSTIGVRETLCNRYILDRTDTVRHTEYGDIHVKQVSGYGVSRSKPEYHDLAETARKHHVSIETIRKAAE